MRRPAPLLLRRLATALLTAGLTAGVARAQPTEPPVRLLSPADGAVLAAGSTATLEWAPPGGPLRSTGSERWEEWEAFLSLDGGASYTVRLTPHLDRELYRVGFRVPDLPTRSGRLLLRV